MHFFLYSTIVWASWACFKFVTGYRPKSKLTSDVVLVIPASAMYK